MIDGAIDVAAGVHADLNWVIERKLRVPDGDPTLAVRATQGIHPLANGFQLDRVIACRISRFVSIKPDDDGQPLTLRFHGVPGGDDEIVVQMWRLMDSGQGTRPRLVLTSTTAPEVPTANESGRLDYVIPAIDTTAYNRLGLIITRVDANESSDPVGEYTIVLSAGACSE